MVLVRLERGIQRHIGMSGRNSESTVQMFKGRSTKQTRKQKGDSDIGEKMTFTEIFNSVLRY